MGMEQECDKETIEDERLLALHAQDGTNRWLGQLYSRYLPLVYGVCLKYLRNPDDAGDAVMDIFEELTVKVGRYEVERFRPWHLYAGQEPLPAAAAPQTAGDTGG